MGKRRRKWWRTHDKRSALLIALAAEPGDRGTPSIVRAADVNDIPQVAREVYDALPKEVIALVQRAVYRLDMGQFGMPVKYDALLALARGWVTRDGRDRVFIVRDVHGREATVNLEAKECDCGCDARRCWRYVAAVVYWITNKEEER